MNFLRKLLCKIIGHNLYTLHQSCHRDRRGSLISNVKLECSRCDYWKEGSKVMDHGY